MTIMSWEFESPSLHIRKSNGFKNFFAEIAQLVEHNLAKVGVASSSLVFRSQAERQLKIFLRLPFFILHSSFFILHSSLFISSLLQSLLCKIHIYERRKAFNGSFFTFTSKHLKHFLCVSVKMSEICTAVRQIGR